MRINETTTDALIVDGETVVAIAADVGMYIPLISINPFSSMHNYVYTYFIYVILKAYYYASNKNFIIKG